jgi:hypothetical protein
MTPLWEMLAADTLVQSRLRELEKDVAELLTKEEGDQ